MNTLLTALQERRNELISSTAELQEKIRSMPAVSRPSSNSSEGFDWRKGGCARCTHHPSIEEHSSLAKKAGLCAHSTGQGMLRCVRCRAHYSSTSGQPCMITRLWTAAGRIEACKEMHLVCVGCILAFLGTFTRDGFTVYALRCDPASYAALLASSPPKCHSTVLPR